MSTISFYFRNEDFGNALVQLAHHSNNAAKRLAAISPGDAELSEKVYSSIQDLTLQIRKNNELSSQKSAPQTANNPGEKPNEP